MKHTRGLVAGSALLLMLAGRRAQSGRLTQALGNVLGGKVTVTSPSPGKMLVYAPQATQASVAAAIAGLGKSWPSEQASAQVRLHFWIVDGITDWRKRPVPARPRCPARVPRPAPKSPRCACPSSVPIGCRRMPESTA